MTLKTNIVIRKAEYLKLAVLVSIFSILVGGNSYANEELEDIEADMESTLSESAAAQSALSAAKKNEEEERVAAKKAKVNADRAIVQAKAKEQKATKELKKLEGQIEQSKKSRARHEKIKADAEAKITAYEQKIQAKKATLATVRAESEAAKSEKEAQQKILAEMVEEQKNLEKNIIKEKSAIKSAQKSIGLLRKEQARKEKVLGRLRLSAQAEARKREKALAENDVMKRQVSQTPTKVISRTAKNNCDLTDSPSEGAKVLSQITVGKRYDIYRVVNKRWVNVQSGPLRGYAEKACF